MLSWYDCDEVIDIPAEGRSDKILDVVGVLTRVVSEGSGPALLLLHGWGCSTEIWKPIWNELAVRYTVVAVDFPGFGRAGKPLSNEKNGLPSPWGVPEYARWTEALIEKLHLAPCAILAHSFGTRVSLVLAAERPELFTKLIFTGACGARLNAGKTSARTHAYKVLRGLTNILGALFPKWAAKRREALVQRFGSDDYKVLDESMRKVFIRVVKQDLREYLPRTGHETLLVWGSQDRDMPLEIGRIMEREMPKARLDVFDGAGHYAFLDAPERFVRAVDQFL